MAKSAKSELSTNNTQTKKEYITSDEVSTKRSENFLSTYANVVKVSANPYDVSILFCSLNSDGIEEKAMIQMSIEGLKGLSDIISNVITDRDKDFSGV
ncbi:hypothetical protein [Gluconobacter kondonii]|uniref:hypothetical protein n=1 Tax=Gluconobacter kondonii TaxID=941463 RepID=UPI001B8BE62D|nr:hypothetical protein [Gluconobacter kondonii]MBS1055020.1 hypothetical protein [Gluconobacter kondonii]